VHVTSNRQERSEGSHRVHGLPPPERGCAVDPGSFLVAGPLEKMAQSCHAIQASKPGLPLAALIVSSEPGRSLAAMPPLFFFFFLFYLFLLNKYFLIFFNSYN
jgi:hypothetical protein